MSFLLGVILLSIVTSLSCALPGVFVVLRRNSMLVDAIGHAVLPGIVLGFYFTQDLKSPWLILGAALAGLVVVLGSELLTRTGLVAGDAPQGLVFPALFSVGIIMISANFSNVHLDTHAVLVGDLNLAAFEQLIVNGSSIGPLYLYVMLAVLAVNIVFLTVLYPKLKITTFDPVFAHSIGIHTTALNFALMFLVSMTVTAAFNAVGAILVVALMIIPPATGYLLSNRLPVMFFWTVVVSAFGALAGFWLAYVLNAPTSAGMAVFYGMLFVAVLVGKQLVRRVHTASARAGHAPAGSVTGDDGADASGGTSADSAKSGTAKGVQETETHTDSLANSPN